MEVKIEKISELSKLLSVKTRMSDDLFHLFGKFDIGHLLSRLSLELAEIYKRRWAIETLYKQLKQNFPLHFFYGESVNAIQIQTWVVLIAKKME